MPSCCAWRVDWSSARSPRTSSSPASGWYAPEMHFTRVDLPAPLSPSRAMISPKRIVRSAPRSASRWPKRFQMPRHSTATVPGSRAATAAASANFEHLHAAAREELDAVAQDAGSVLPTTTELRADHEGVDLERHVLRKRVVRGLLHPGRLDLDQTEPVARPVQVQVVPTVLGEVGAVALRDVARGHACPQPALGCAVRVEGELEDVSPTRARPSPPD